MFGRGSDDIGFCAGCTACSALITPTDIYVANAGDSRAVLAVKKSDKFKAIELSVDHKPDLPEEK
jgi:protein phosphatase PTC2/3